MKECPTITSGRGDIVLLKDIPDELRKYQLPGTVSVMAKGHLTSILIHHFKGNGFDILYSNYLENKSGTFRNDFKPGWGDLNYDDQQFGMVYMPFIGTKLEFPGGPDYHTFDIYFSKEIVQPYAACCRKLALFLEAADKEKPANMLDIIRFISPSMMRIIVAILDYKFHEDLAINYFTGLIHELLTLVTVQVSAIADAPEIALCELNKAREARKIIISDFEEYNTVEELARKVGTSELKLQLAFKHLFGTSVFKFSRQARLQKGFDLLHQTDYPLRVICTMVGYPDPANFSVAFKKQYGFWPGYIQKKIKK
jgi:AraC-like DNA-binding protein